jgi:oxygen-dependent protoporphyrinogen oxidase
MNRIVVAGAGVTGLSIARAIRRRDPRAEVVVVEGNTQPGGNVKTELIDGYLCEWGADGFLDNAPDTLALVRELGLQDRLLPSRDAARRRFIYSQGVLHEVPVSPGAFFKSGLLPASAKARIAWEPFARRRPEGDETIHDFAARRIGAQAASVMIDSMVSGIFAGDARALSLRACFPKMWQMETDHGGLFRAMLATRKRRKKEDAMGAPAGHLTSFNGGMTELIQGLAAALGSAVRTSNPVIELQRGRRAETFGPAAAAPGYSVVTPRDRFEADAVVLTGPSSEAAALVRPFDSTLASLLSGIATAPLAVLCLGFDEAALVRDRGELNGFGFLIPRRENIRMLGALWESAIYPNRAPAGKALMRVMIGGARDPEAIELDDDTLLAIVRDELRRTMGLRIPPEFVRIVRHRRGIPQYVVGHVARLQRIDVLLQAHPGLILAGNSYRGVSINSCVAESDAIAERVLAHVNRTTNEAARVRTAS